MTASEDRDHTIMAVVEEVAIAAGPNTPLLYLLPEVCRRCNEIGEKGISLAELARAARMLQDMGLLKVEVMQQVTES